MLYGNSFLAGGTADFMGLLGLFTWVVWLIVGVLLIIWLWKQIRD